MVTVVEQVPPCGAPQAQSFSQPRVSIGSPEKKTCFFVYAAGQVLSPSLAMHSPLSKGVLGLGRQTCPRLHPSPAGAGAVQARPSPCQIKLGFSVRTRSGTHWPPVASSWE